MKYDLKAMKFDPDENCAFGMFGWDETPEGSSYWMKHDHNPHQEGRDKIAAMLKQWKEEQAMTKDGIFLSRRVSDEELITMTQPPRPAIDVLHKHDGSSKGPLPVGTEHTWWSSDMYCEWAKETHRTKEGWEAVTQYLVHSYPPKTKKVTGTVTYTNGKPDFKTWAPCTGNNSKP